MKKISAFLIIMIAMLMAGVCAHAAEFDVENTFLPMGKAYEEYNGQINMVGGNDGYSFEFVSGFMPTGLTVNSDGSITGTPTSAGYYSSMDIRIKHKDGTSRIVSFQINITPRAIKINITAPKNVVYDGDEHKAVIECYDMNDNKLSELVPTVKYGKNYLSAAVDAGTYYISISVPGCSIKQRTGDTHLEIEKHSASISVTSSKEYIYDQQPHGIEANDVTVTPIEAGYIVEYSRNGSNYTTDIPVASGTYTVRVRTSNPNYETVYAQGTLRIVGEVINFNVTNTSFTYDGDWHKLTITPSKDNIDYTVTYTNSKNEVVENPTDADVYTITITLVDSSVYSIGNDYENKLTISPKTAHFEAEDGWEYDGEAHTPKMTITPDFDSSLYTVAYRKRGTNTNLTQITDAGVYDIVITFQNGNYAADDSSSKTITVKAKTVNFNVSGNNIDYDGSTHIATVTPTITLADNLYSVKYRKKDTTELLDNVKNAGIYDIVISFVNDNYTLDNSFNATMTINATYILNIGNSPAAMIYKDETHNAQWQEKALEYLENNRSFNTDYLPTGCVADIKYNLINGIDVDCDVNTVIVSDLDDFVDPGMQVNDGVTTKTVTGDVQETDIDGMYKVVYTQDGVTNERYLLVVNRRIGDVNGDGAVNNIDANCADIVNAEVDGVTQARIYDVNKDGRVDSKDAAAIRNRFNVKLQPYYPWL